jgi:demethylmenaquinone methyltransferase/2-methoxy-6-polyprenyl-1,4-benzoquinol methylase
MNNSIVNRADIQRMFSSIASRYDLLDTLLSFNRDKYWRKFAGSQTELKPGGKALDVATGTGKLALETAKEVGGRGEVIGVDFCEEMLSQARDKLAKTKYQNAKFILARAESLPFPDDTFDSATIGFGLRNVADIGQVLREMTRVVKTGGKVVCLEFGQPRHPVFSPIYHLYLFRFLPFLGRVASGNGDAYSYLPKSIMDFFSPYQLKQIMSGAGLQDIKVYFLTMGIVTTHVGIKRMVSPLLQGKEQ